MKFVYTSFLKLPLFLFYKLPKKGIEYAKKTIEIINLTSSSDIKTLHIAETRKSKVIIFHELFLWLIKYGAVNDKYYLYGCDRKNSEDQSSFLGYKQFKKLRNIKNLNPNVEDKDGFNYVCILRDKILFSEVMTSYGLAVVKNIAVFNSNRIKWLKTGTVYSIEEFLKNDEISFDGFSKKIDGGLGKGAFKFEKDEGKIFLNNKLINIDDLKSSIEGNYIIQNRIIQHKKMNDLYPHAVNCIRILTIRDHLSSRPFLATLKMGIAKSNIDNFGAGGVDVKVDLDTGKLADFGFANLQNISLVDKHPDTATIFKNYKIPFFKSAVELAVQAHNKLYGIHSIGWDIAITKNGPILIEGNDDWGGGTAMYYKGNFKKEFLQMYKKAEHSIFDNIYYES